MKEALWCQSDIKTHSQKLKPNVQLAVNLRCSTDNWILFYHQWLWGKWRNSVAISQTQPVPQLTPYLTEEFCVSMGNWGLGNLQKSLPLGQKLGPKHSCTMYPRGICALCCFILALDRWKEATATDREYFLYHHLPKQLLLSIMAKIGFLLWAHCVRRSGASTVASQPEGPGFESPYSPSASIGSLKYSAFLPQPEAC